MKKHTLNIAKYEEGLKVTFNNQNDSTVASKSLNKAISKFKEQWETEIGYVHLKALPIFKNTMLTIDWIIFKRFGDEIGFRCKSSFKTPGYEDKHKTELTDGEWWLFSSEIFSEEEVEKNEMKIDYMRDSLVPLAYDLLVEIEACMNGYDANMKMFNNPISETE
jgi:hypothetical protein